MTTAIPDLNRLSDDQSSAQVTEPFRELGLSEVDRSSLHASGQASTRATSIATSVASEGQGISKDLAASGYVSRRELRQPTARGWRLRGARRVGERTRFGSEARSLGIPNTPGNDGLPVGAVVFSRSDSVWSSRVSRMTRATFPPVVLAAATALLIGTSVPTVALLDRETLSASALTPSTAGDIASDAQLSGGQVLGIVESAHPTITDASRGEWSVTSYAEMLRLKYGNLSYSYSTSGTGAVRWPFPTAVPISSGFGNRVAPCRSCSSYHQGLDFNPGAGTPIFAIADGTVLQSERSGGFGQHAIIEHVINGQRVISTYAHMTGGSSPLVPGQQVSAGDLVGTVGNTGVSTGAHLHLEIRIDDTTVDPFRWLRENAS